LLATLDSTLVTAQLEMLNAQQEQALIREARLVAEIGGERTFPVPPAIADRAEADGTRLALDTELHVLDVRWASMESLAAQLAEQIQQLMRQIDGMELQLQATEQQLAIIGGERQRATELLRGGLIETSRVSELERQASQLDGERGRLIASIAQVSAAIAERRLQISQLEQDHLSKALAELQETRLMLYDIMQDLNAANDRLRRTELRAPQAGVIHQSIIHTIGGVIGAGETVMQLVPQDEALLVDVRVAPTDIEKVSVGQEVSLRLLGFNHRLVPELAASIVTVPPDLTQDPITGGYFYRTRVSIPEDQLAILPEDAKLVPGMPVEAFVKTADRTIMDYLLEPLAGQLSYALREE
jgi:HlyD family secretion protein